MGVHNFFDELYSLFDSCFKEYMRELKKDDLEENGKIYYMNDRRDTIFEYSMNNHLCPFMCFYNSGMGAIKVTVYMNGNVIINLYNDKETKPFETINKRINDKYLLDVAILLYSVADKSNLFSSSINDMDLDIIISEEEKKEFCDACGIEYLSNHVACKYVNELKNKYILCGKEKQWNDFKENKKKSEKIDEIKNKYSKIPYTLLSLLDYSDGTNIHFFGTNFEKEEISYRLLSSDEILKSVDYINIKSLKIISDKIINDFENTNWIIFASSIDSKYKSQLFIDLTPSTKGVKGQIIRYIEDLDSVDVIANSFDEYLNKLIKNKISFIKNDIILNEEKELEKKNEIEVRNEKIETNNTINNENRLKINVLSLSIISLIDLVAFSIIIPTNNILLYIAILLFVSCSILISINCLVKIIKNKIKYSLINMVAIMNMFLSIIYMSQKSFNIFYLFIIIVTFIFGIWTLIITNKKL